MKRTKPILLKPVVESFGPLEHVPCNLCGSWDRKLLCRQRHWYAPADVMGIVKCSRCALIFTSPRPTVEWARNSVLPQNRPDNVQDPSRPSHRFEHQNESMANYLQGLELLRKAGKAKGTLVDVGSGGGRFVELATRSGYKAIGCDIDINCVESGRMRGLELYCAELQELSLEKDSIDVVTLWNCLSKF